MSSNRQKQLTLLAFFLIPIASLFAGGNNDEAGSGQDAGISSRAAIGHIDAASTGPLYEGDGGAGIRLAVLEPEAMGLTPMETYLPVYVQGLLNNNLGKYSAMTLTERQNLNQILKEKNMTANGNFSETDYIAIGNLTNTQYILLGAIQKIPGNQFSVQLAITDLSNRRTQSRVYEKQPGRSAAGWNVYKSGDGRPARPNGRTNYGRRKTTACG